MPRIRGALRPAASMFLLLGALASACGGGGNNYPEAAKQNFLRACIGGVVTFDMCNCMINDLEKRYSVEEFQAMEARLVIGEAVPAFDQIIEDCVDKHR